MVVKLGSLLSYSVPDGSGVETTYTDIATLTVIQPGKLKHILGNGTTLDSPGGFKQASPGWLDMESGGFTVRYTRTLYNTLQGILKAKAFYWWRIRHNDGTTSTSGSTWKCKGYLIEIGESDMKEGDPDPVDIECKIQFEGDPVTAAAT